MNNNDKNSKRTVNEAQLPEENYPETLELNTQVHIVKRENSLSIQLPEQAPEKLGLLANQKYTVSVSDGKIMIQQTITKEPKTLEELFEDWDGGPIHEGELDWGPDVGSERW